MALANKNHMPNESTMAIIQASAFYEHNFGATSLINHSSSSPEDHIYGLCEPESPEKAKPGLANNFTMSNSSSVSSPSSTNSNGLGYNQANNTAYNNNLSEEGNSVISFKPEYGNFIHASGSLLSFEQSKNVQRNLFPKMMEDEYPMWEDHDLHHPNSYQSEMIINPKCSTNHGLPETSSSHHAGGGYGSPSGGAQFAWLNDQEANTIANGIDQELGSNNKRPSTGENVQALKKQCVVASSSDSKKLKSKSASTTKDPQSVAAKNRRERISERLKTLQELVPNGSKVDLVTMLEKAISYVKFLQLQVKVLATDEFWPAQGGKAPDLSQVREAIDAILASQRDRNSSSK
ncbi:hypothetical protein DH2020_015984 [Rehmannia glutinosa]|uniref:BHLH domain-containing protein n=1 Tax=Rehmannia glutinosa TaxID=99300 RepID=A0ABR0WU68_REHGL